MRFSNAKKIWNAEVSGVNVFADFKADFGRADRIKIACDGNYSLYINNKFVGTGQYPGYEDMLFFDALDIGKFADLELNTLKIVAHHPGCDFLDLPESAALRDLRGHKRR